ncbi:MAG: hypothetical protein PGN11_05825 [Quadrisphaera sp.]
MSVELKVVRLMTDRELAVSGGESAGLKTGDVLLVLGEPITIEDPDTGEVLGEVVNHKAVVRVYDVKERFALARTFRTRQVNVGGSVGIGLSNIFEAPKYERRTETLRRAPKAGNEIFAAESVVEVGDRVEVFHGDVKDVPSLSVWR